MFNMPHWSDLLIEAEAREKSPPQCNHQRFVRTSLDSLYNSAAFRKGFEDYRSNRPFHYPAFLPGPTPTIKSAQIAYETGRQFAARLRAEEGEPASLVSLRRRFSGAFDGGQIK